MSGALSIALAAGIAAPAAPAAPPRCAGEHAAVGPPTRALAWQARVVAVTPVRRSLAGRERTRALDPADAAAVLVLDARLDPRGRCRLRVRLPTRPNHAAGWIDAHRVRLRATPYRIEVRRARRTVTLLRAGKRIRRFRAVVGTSGTPTPTGRFAVASVWRNRPGHFLGSWVLALSAHSEVLDTYDGGEGRVAIHGRGGASLRDPLGSAASHGCVRLSNAAIEALVRTVGEHRLPGVPVRVRR